MRSKRRQSAVPVYTTYVDRDTTGMALSGTTFSMNLQYFRSQLLSGNLFREWLARLPDKWQHLPVYLRLYAALLISAGLLFQLSYPITLLDSDMWYHLDGGRYFWQHGSVPNHSFFSFVEPERLFVNYYWGFQALIAKIYEYSGYYGLLVLRALIFALTTFLAYRYIIEERSRNFPVLLFFLLFIVYFTFIEGRVVSLRPHLFSHLFILLFIYILERRPRWAPALPLITAAWVNLHGIVYPVPVLIGGAYFVEILYQRLINKEQHGDRGWREGLWLLACAPALLATPHGFDLLEAPFGVSSLVGLYIGEMKPINPRVLYTVAITGDNLNIESIFPIAFIVCTFALLRTLLNGSLRISHAIMAVGAYLLLFRGTRFLWEWALLVLPLLTHFTGNLKEIHGERKYLSILHLFMLVMLVLPFVSMAKRIPFHTDFPFDRESAPIGIASFLQQAGGGGKLFAPPTTAGFLHWELSPDYKIFADLQMSLFNDLDIFHLFSFYRTQNGMARIIEQYQPDYISAGLKNRSAKLSEEILQNRTEYVPVFAGDQQVLYVNKILRPGVAEKYRLKLVDPFSLTSIKEGAAVDDHIEELKKMLAVYPESDRINHAITRLLFDEQRFQEALPWAERFMHYQPENPYSHYLLGNIHEHSGNFEKAIEYYNSSMRYSDKALRLILNTRIGSSNYAKEDFAAAYHHFKRGLDPYNNSTAETAMYQFAYSAFVVGKTDEAILLLKMLLHTAPVEKNDITLETQKLLDTLQKYDDETPSFFEWVLSFVFEKNDNPGTSSQ